MPRGGWTRTNWVASFLALFVWILVYGRRWGVRLSPGRRSKRERNPDGTGELSAAADVLYGQWTVAVRADCRLGRSGEGRPVLVKVTPYSGDETAVSAAPEVSDLSSTNR